MAVATSTAILAGAGIAAGVAGGAMSASAAKSAAKKQAASADAATAEQQRQYDITRSDYMPFLQAGTAGANQLSYLLGINQQPYDTTNEYGEDITVDPYATVNKDMGKYGDLTKSFGMAEFEADPGYAFRLAEGQKALDRASSAGGKYFSGQAIKGLERYNQDMASQEYQNAYNRYTNNQTNLYNRLAGISGTGQTTANALAGAGQNAANNISSNIIGAGNAQAAGNVGAANAWSTGLSGATNNAMLAYFLGGKK